MKIFIIICIISWCVLLFGCAEYRAIAGSKGKTASDAALNDALWVICKASPVGAIKRKFNTIEKLIQYNNICEDQDRLQIEP